MATGSKVSSIQKIMINSSRVGSQNIDKISLMRIPDMDSSLLQADEYNNGAYNKIKKAVNSKPLPDKYRKLPNFGSCEEIYHSSANNGNNIDESDEQNTRAIIGDVPGHTPYYIKQKANKLSVVSKPRRTKDLKTVADNSNTDGKCKIDIIPEFSVTDQNERLPSKEMKNRNQKKKMERKKKSQGKELATNSSKQSRADTQYLIAETEIKDSEIKPSSVVIGNDKSTSNATVSKLRRSCRLPINPRKDYNAILGKGTRNNNQNASVKVKMEIFNESQRKEENLEPNIHQKNMGTYDKEYIVNDGIGIQNTNQKDKDNEMKPYSAGIENNKSTSNATVSELRPSCRLPITPRKDYNATLGKGTHNNNQNASVKVKMEIFNDSQRKEENLVPNIHQKNMGTYDKEYIVNIGEYKEDESRDPNAICSHELQKVTFENLKNEVVSKVNNKNTRKTRKENKKKSERDSVLKGSNRISVLPDETVATKKGLLGNSKEANEDTKDAIYNENGAICSDELQKVKSEFIKSDVTVKRERAKNSRSSTISLTTVPLVRHVNIRYKNPSGDLHGLDDNVESNSRSKNFQKRKVTSENRKRMVPSEANNSNAGNKGKENKMKNEYGTFLRRSNRISLLPPVCYR